MFDGLPSRTMPLRRHGTIRIDQPWFVPGGQHDIVKGMLMNDSVRCFQSSMKMASEAAGFIAAAAVESVDRQGFFTLVLSGGGTPRATYETLAGPAGNGVNWRRVHVFWGDERCVPPEDPQSNYRMAYDSLISRIPIPSGNVHRIHGEHPDPDAAAREYEEDIRSFLRKCDDCYREPPSFDLILLGVGADGHTASLFPHSEVLNEHERLVRHVVAPDYAPVRDRITMTPLLLNRAKRILFLVGGGDKRDVVGRALDEPPSPAVPAGMIEGAGETFWFTNFN